MTDGIDVEGMEPLSRLPRDDGTPEWQVIEGLFRVHNMPRPSIRLRDELVMVLAWARYGEAAQARIRVLEAVVEDLLSLECGEIRGQSQRDGIVREARAALNPSEGLEGSDAIPEPARLGPQAATPNSATDGEDR